MIFNQVLKNNLRSEIIQTMKEHLEDPDAVYINSLADDLKKVADEARHFAWCVEEGEKISSRTARAIVNNIQKIATLFKERIK